MAQLTGMTLIKNGITITQMINFGQPRVGDPKYAAFSDEKWTTQWRMVHHKDIVPHNPGEACSFFNDKATTEIYADKDPSIYKTCAKGEDPTCADQWWTFSIDDHLNYMGKPMGSDGATSCAVKANDAPKWFL